MLTHGIYKFFGEKLIQAPQTPAFPVCLRKESRFCFTCSFSSSVWSPSQLTSEHAQRPSLGAERARSCPIPALQAYVARGAHSLFPSCPDQRCHFRRKHQASTSEGWGQWGVRGALNPTYNRQGDFKVSI